jgi:hypothetical protein
MVISEDSKLVILVTFDPRSVSRVPILVTFDPRSVSRVPIRVTLDPKSVSRVPMRVTLEAKSLTFEDWIDESPDPSPEIETTVKAPTLAVP